MSSTGLNWLVLDLNSFFASCEQQETPKLRGKPIAVVPMMAESTCAIAASYPAKAFGIKTGTLVSEARRLCPEIVFVQARHKLYVAYHHKILAAIEKYIPIDDVMSVDEVACRLDCVQQKEDNARALGLRLKQAILEEVGSCLTSSVGIGPNVMLAKTASNMKKPDGLTLLRQQDLPRALLSLSPQALPGIGPNMMARLARVGLTDMAALWAADASFLRRVWGGLGGVRFHALLHGEDLASRPTERRSIGHQHVLSPAQRTLPLAQHVTRQLLIRAAGRLRKEGFFCRRLTLDIKWTQNLGHHLVDQTLPETQDTRLLLHALEALWQNLPAFLPLRVGITLGDLVETTNHQPDLFERRENAALIKTIDALNQKYGLGTVTLGKEESAWRAKIAFSRVPKSEEL